MRLLKLLVPRWILFLITDQVNRFFVRWLWFLHVGQSLLVCLGIVLCDYNIGYIGYNLFVDGLFYPDFIGFLELVPFYLARYVRRVTACAFGVFVLLVLVLVNHLVSSFSYIV